ncbi:MAG: aromatic ring-hydroxylating dioxygenase subunit alpha [Gammaproteobacteria bacterium]
MHKHEQIRLLKGLINHLDNKTNINAGGIIKTPADTYTSEERFTREWDSFFLNHPQIIGLSGDLPKADTFITTEDFGVPVLATRNSKGEFKAYVNICSHRGVIVENVERGEKSKFSCPFHGWTYSNEGDLIGYPKSEQFGNIEKTCYGLKELPALEKFGFLWVHPSQDGVIDLEDLLGDELIKEFDSWRFEDLIFSNEDVYTTEMNWKLAIDTFGETYHFSVLHKDSLFQSFYGNCQMFDSFKRNGRLILCKRTIDELRDLSESEWDICAGSLPVYYLFPNIIFIPTLEGAFLVKEYPAENSPHKSYSKISFYFHPHILEHLKELEKTGINAKQLLQDQYEGFASVIRDEDYAVAASSHKGLRSGNLDYLTFGKNEPALHHYHNTYREALGLQPLPLEEV